MTTCFNIYFQPVYLYVKRGLNAATNSDGHYFPTVASTLFAGTYELISKAYKIELFGIPNLLLCIVIMTILTDTYFGVQASKKKSKEALKHARKCDINTPEYRKYIKIAKLRKFDPKKLQFTFFKVLTLLGYLFFARILLSADFESELDGILGLTSGLILKVPIVIFWYYDFKSIGRNSAYLYGKKAPIFTVVESIFDFKLKKFWNDKK